MTLMQESQKGNVSDRVAQMARQESMPGEKLARKIAAGRAVVLANRNKTALNGLAIGEGLRTKINANIGTSPDSSSLENELRKLEAALEAGADAVMDLSVGGDVNSVRAAIIDRSPVPVGTVPIYQTVLEAARERKAVPDITADDLLATIARHAEDGVDFVTVHCGIKLDAVERLRRNGRVGGIVSRGGSILAEWMIRNGKENPLYERYDDLLSIAAEAEVVLSLGDGLRPGCLADATDEAQLSELRTIGELIERARERGVQAIVEGPGHVPLHQVENNILLEKQICDGAPFYVLGPIVTDVTPGYDHISAAIGGAVAAASGADFLCYVTPAEHLCLPGPDEVREGVIALRIAAHAGDIAKGVPGAARWDREMSDARRRLDWEKMFSLALEPKKARVLRGSSLPSESDLCTMCGEFCAVKRTTGVLKPPDHES